MEEGRLCQVRPCCSQEVPSMSCFSLRGKFRMDDNSRLNPLRLFDYVSPDRTRAWQVTRAYVWP